MASWSTKICVPLLLQYNIDPGVQLKTTFPRYPCVLDWPCDYSSSTEGEAKAIKHTCLPSLHSLFPIFG